MLSICFLSEKFKTHPTYRKRTRVNVSTVGELKTILEKKIKRKRRENLRAYNNSEQFEKKSLKPGYAEFFYDEAYNLLTLVYIVRAFKPGSPNAFTLEIRSKIIPIEDIEIIYDNNPDKVLNSLVSVASFDYDRTLTLIHTHYFQTLQHFSASEEKKDHFHLVNLYLPELLKVVLQELAKLETTRIVVTSNSRKKEYIESSLRHLDALDQVFHINCREGDRAITKLDLLAENVQRIREQPGVIDVVCVRHIDDEEPFPYRKTKDGPIFYADYGVETFYVPRRPCGSNGFPDSSLQTALVESCRCAQVYIDFLERFGVIGHGLIATGFPVDYDDALERVIFEEVFTEEEEDGITAAVFSEDPSEKKKKVESDRSESDDECMAAGRGVNLLQTVAFGLDRNKGKRVAVDRKGTVESLDETGAISIPLPEKPNSNSLLILLARASVAHSTPKQKDRKKGKKHGKKAKKKENGVTDLLITQRGTLASGGLTAPERSKKTKKTRKKEKGKKAKIEYVDLDAEEDLTKISGHGGTGILIPK